MRKPTKLTVVIAVTVAVLGTGAGAYAYWLSTGTGTGTGGAATVASTVKVAQLSSISGLGPGVAAIVLNGTFLNEGLTAAHVKKLAVAVDTVTGGAGGTPACAVTDYTIVGSPLTIDADLPVSATGTTAWSGPTIAFKETALDQSACIGATVNLKYTIS